MGSMIETTCVLFCCFVVCFFGGVVLVMMIGC